MASITFLFYFHGWRSHQYNFYQPAGPPQLLDELLDLPLIFSTEHNFDDIPTQDETSAAAADFDTAPTNLLEVINSNIGKPMMIHENNIFQERYPVSDGSINNIN